MDFAAAFSPAAVEPLPLLREKSGRRLPLRSPPLLPGTGRDRAPRVRAAGRDGEGARSAPPGLQQPRLPVAVGLPLLCCGSEVGSGSCRLAGPFPSFPRRRYSRSQRAGGRAGAPSAAAAHHGAPHRPRRAIVVAARPLLTTINY